MKFCLSKLFQKIMKNDFFGGLIGLIGMIIIIALITGLWIFLFYLFGIFLEDIFY